MRLWGIVLVAFTLLAGCATAPDARDWPATVVSFDDMQRLTPLEISFYKKLGADNPRGRSGWQLWVDEAGMVRNVRMIESSGHPAFDEAVMRGAWKLRFVPWRVDGQPRAVTVMMPVQMI